MMRIDPYRFRRRTAPDCAIYSINEALEIPATVVSQEISPDATAVAVQLTPLDDGNRHRLMVAVVIIDNVDFDGSGGIVRSIESVTWGGGEPAYYSPINNYCMLVACLIDEFEPEHHNLIITFDGSMSGGEVKVQPLWFGNVSGLIYSKAAGYYELYDAPDTSDYESVLFVASFFGFVAEGFDPSAQLTSPSLPTAYTEDNWPNVDMRFEGAKPVARTAVYVGPGTAATDAVIRWTYERIRVGTSCSSAIIAVSLCDGELE
jgi:hypothetical protein